MPESAKIAGGRLVRKGASPLLDVLVVGAGPTGSSAAFALKEAGRQVLVVDRDDILARARDGAGPFPTHSAELQPPIISGQVGRLLSDLARSQPDVGAWRVTYATLDVPKRMDMELISLKQLADGSYKATLMNHDSGEHENICARQVLLATGSGRPISESIEHQLVTMPLRIGELADHSGQAVCVLGASTAAVEAVLALATIKIKNQDPAPILWCGAGSRLPRVARDLQQAFYRAYVVYDKIRFHPGSQLRAILTDTHEPHASICVESKALGGVWHTNHIEIPISRCLLAAGRESPVSWLESLGIECTEVNGVPLVQLHGGFRCSLPGIFLAGSMLSPSHRLCEKGEERLIFREDSMLAAVSDGLAVAHHILHEQQPAAPEPKKTTTEGLNHLTGFHISRLLKDGARAEYYPISSRGVTIGKKGTNIVFPEDPMVADLHASVLRRTGKHVLRDEDSSTGVFFKLPMTTNTTVNRGDLVRLGAQFLVFDTNEQGAWARHYDSKGNEGQLFHITDDALVLGKEGSHILATDDETLAPRHLVLCTIAGTILARDLGSFHGSYLRVMRDHRLSHGDIFMVGREHLMFIDQLKEAELAKQDPSPPPKSAKGAASVIFEGHGGPILLSAGENPLRAAAQIKLALKTQCCAGACGSDPVEIIKGMENVDPQIDPLEAETLKRICGLTPGTFRLACKLRIFGPVTLRLIKESS